MSEKKGNDWLKENYPALAELKDILAEEHPPVKKGRHYITINHKITEVIFNYKSMTEAERCVLGVLMREIWGWNNQFDVFSFSQIAEWTGVSRRNTLTACKNLMKRNIILFSQVERGCSPEFKNPNHKDKYPGQKKNQFFINKYYFYWLLGPDYKPYSEWIGASLKGDAHVTFKEDSKGDAHVTFRKVKGDASITFKGDASITFNELYTLLKKKREKKNTYVCENFSLKREEKTNEKNNHFSEKRNGQSSPLVTTADDNKVSLEKLRYLFDTIVEDYPPKRVSESSDLKLWEDMFWNSGSPYYQGEMTRELYGQIKSGVKNYIEEEGESSVSWFNHWLKNKTWKKYQQTEERNWPTPKTI